MKYKAIGDLNNLGSELLGKFPEPLDTSLHRRLDLELKSELIEDLYWQLNIVTHMEM